VGEHNVNSSVNNEADRMCSVRNNLANIKLASLKWSLKSKCSHSNNLRKLHSIAPIVKAKEHEGTSLLNIRHKALIESIDSKGSGRTSEATQIQSSQRSNTMQRRNAFTEKLKAKCSLEFNSQVIKQKYKSINTSIRDYKSLKEEFPEMKSLIKLPLIKAVNVKCVEDEYLKLLEEKHGYREDSEGVVVDEELKNNMDRVIKGVNEQKINPQTNTLTLSKDDISTIKSHEDFKTIEEILSKINFFVTLRREERIEIIKEGQLKRYTNTDTINHNDQIFIILKGKVDVLINNKIIKRLSIGNIYTKEYYTTGDDSISIEVKANTYTFVINRDKFIEMMHTKLKKEFYLKLYTIKSCSIFIDIPLPQLLIFALNLELTKKQYNEVIIKQGKVPMKCYVVAKGLCRLVVDSIETMPSSPSIYARNSQRNKPKALRFGMNNFSMKKTLKSNEITIDSTKNNFSYENQLLGRTIGGSIRYKAQVVCHCTDIGYSCHC
jgi:hypothetical protein